MGISKAHSDKPNKLQGGPGRGDLAFITHITGSTSGSRSAEQDCTHPQSETRYTGSQIKAAWVQVTLALTWS